MKELFLHISDRLTTDVPTIRWIDFDLGQFDGGQNPPVSFPAALVAFEQASYVPLSAGKRTARQAFRLRIGFVLRERTHSKTESSFRSDALEHLDVIEAAKNALVGTSSGAFSGIRLDGQSNEQRADHRIYQLSFSCQIWEEPTDPTYKPVPEYPNATLPLEACVHPEVVD